MDWRVWIVFVVAEGALTVTPGPAVLFVVSQGLRGGTAGALWSAAGILAANAVYFAISGTGVGAALAASGSLFTWIKGIGGAYLLYLGAVALLRRPPFPGEREPSDGSNRRDRSLLLRGLVVQLSNPKALLFFVAILPQFIDRSRPIVGQILVLGVTSIVVEFLVLAAYGAAAAGSARVLMQPRYAIATSRLSGLLLVAAALGLLWLKR